MRHFLEAAGESKAVGTLAGGVTDRPAAGPLVAAAGLADATWTLVPKNEWDVAGGTALVRAAGGAVWRPDGEPLRFNQPKTLLPGLLATPAGLEQPVRDYLEAAS